MFQGQSQKNDLLKTSLNTHLFNNHRILYVSSKCSVQSWMETLATMCQIQSWENAFIASCVKKYTLLTKNSEVK